MFIQIKLISPAFPLLEDQRSKAKALKFFKIFQDWPFPKLLEKSYNLEDDHLNNFQNKSGIWVFFLLRCFRYSGVCHSGHQLYCLLFTTKIFWLLTFSFLLKRNCVFSCKLILKCGSPFFFSQDEKIWHGILDWIRNPTNKLQLNYL